MPRDTILRRHRRTKIVATLGPASSDPAMIGRLVTLGVDVFRLNFSHGTHEDHAARVAAVREIERERGIMIGLLADVQGPKLRIGRFAAGRVHLQPGQSFRLDMNPSPGDSTRVTLAHPEIIAAARAGTSLLLDDGRLRLRVDQQRADHLITTVITGGTLSDRKGVNVPDVALDIPALTEKDRIDIAFAVEQGVDFIGLSFVQRAADVIEARGLSQGRAAIIAKIEKPQAVAELDAILAEADGLMVARGDLGVELPPEEVPLIQKRLVAAARQAGKPVIVATQMLESMVAAPTPTRAEASDVATAVFDGADAVMLSAESASGQYPAEAVEMMDRILTRTERDEGWRRSMATSRPAAEPSVSGAIAYAASEVAANIGAALICAYTASGASAQRVARARPMTTILALVTSAQVGRRLALVWGVCPVASPMLSGMTDAVKRAQKIAREQASVAPGSLIVIAAGMPFGTTGATNALRVAEV